MWGGLRSFQNPIGSVYHDPEATDWNLGAGVRPDETETDETKDDDRSRSSRNLLPYETLSGANYPYLNMRPGDGYYVSTRTPPLYTSARYLIVHV